MAIEKTIQRIWHFGQLIANADMHDGNLDFRPGLKLASVYDMLPMLYASARGVELRQRLFSPKLPSPTEAETWLDAAGAATELWRLQLPISASAPAFSTSVPGMPRH